MAMETTGTIHMVGETKQVSDKFSKREFVLSIADNPKYPQLVAFELVNDRVQEIDGYSVGDTVRVEFSLRGREWRSPSGEIKYFNTLSTWKIEGVGQRAKTNGAPPPPTEQKGAEDDIPFLSCDLADEPSAIARVLR